MGALERFEQQGDQIKDAYASLQDEIFRLIINALKEGDYKHVDQDDVVLWQAQQLQKIGQLNRDTMRLMAQTDGVSQQAIEDFVKFNGLDVADEVDDEVKQVAPQRTAMPAQTSVGALMAGIAQQTWTNLQNNVNESLITRNYGESAVTYTYRQILTESTAATVTGLSTHQDAIETAIYRAVDRGLPTRLVDKAGHHWSMEGYTSMVVDTTTHRTYNEIRLQRMKDFHMGQCVMSSHPASRPACAPIQGQVVNVVPPDDPDFDPKYDGIYNHGYGEPSGTQGINCRHRLFPFVPGVSENHQPQYDPDEAIKNGKIVQQQRARERAIRDAKHRLAVAEELGDEKMISRTKTLIRARQASMREFIQDTNHGRKVPLLHRDYSREKIAHVENASRIKEFIQGRLTQRTGKQRQHVYGTKEYNERTQINWRRHQKGKAPEFYKPSYFTISADELDKIVKDKINLKKIGEKQQFIHTDNPVGYYRTTRNGKFVEYETNRIQIHLSKNGYHAVPALPNHVRRGD